MFLRFPFFRRSAFRRLSLCLLGLLVGVLMLAIPAQALRLESGDEVFLNEFLTENVYVAGGNVTIQQDIEGDVWIGGGTVTVNGIINGDLVLASGTVIVNAPVRDDVRMVGGSLSLNANVDGDLIVVGGTADLNKEAVVAGDLILVAGSTNLYGTVNRSVRGILGRLVIGGQINGDVNVRVTEKLVLLNESHVAGNVTYFSPEKIEDHGGVIDGEIAFNEILSSTESVKEGIARFFNRGYFIGKLWSLLSLLLIGIVFLVLFPHLLPHTSEQIKKGVFKHLGVGFLVFVLGGVASIIAVLTVVGVQLGFMMMAILFVFGELGRITSAYWLGSTVIRHRQPKKGASQKHALWIHLGVLAAGLVLIKIIGMLPFVGMLSGFFFLLVGSGALFSSLRGTYHVLLKERVV